MAQPMKSWHVTVLMNSIKEVACITCVNAKQATERLAEVKEQFVNKPEDPKAPRYTYHREYY